MSDILTDPKLEATLNQRVTVDGTARNAHAGAVVLTAERTPVFVNGLLEWPDADHGKSVQATGVLTRKSLAPDPTVGADGGHTHGIEGTNYVLDDAAWTFGA